MIVTIPSRQDHEGIFIGTYEISDNCPICGQKRGAIYQTISYDGSRRLHCDGWDNPCGHLDLYSRVREEAEKFKQLINK